MAGGAAEGGEDAFGHLHAAQVLGAGFAAHQDHPAVRATLVAVVEVLRILGEELDTATGCAGTGVNALCEQLALGDRLALRVGIEKRLQQLVQVIRRDTVDRDGFLPVDQLLLDHIHREADGGEAGTLAVAGLEHPQLAALDGEFDVLHIAVVLLQLEAHLVELLVDRGHLGGEFLDLLGGADAGHHILALGVGEVLAVENVFAGGGVAGEGDAGAAVVTHVAEHHRADVGGCAPLVGDVVLAAVNDRAVVHPGAEHRADGAVHLLARVFGEIVPSAGLHCFLEAVNQHLQVGDGQLVVEGHAALVLEVVHDLLEGILFLLVLGLQAQHHIPVHLDETAVGVPGEALVAGLLDQAGEGFLVEADVQHGIHHAGHGVSGAGTAGNQQGVFRIAQLGAHGGFGLLDVLVHLGLQFRGILLAVGVEIRAHLGGEGEAGGYGQADLGHLSQVCTLATQQGLHTGVAVSLAIPKKIHVFVTHNCPAPRNDQTKPPPCPVTPVTGSGSKSNNIGA